MYRLVQFEVYREMQIRRKQGEDAHIGVPLDRLFSAWRADASDASRSDFCTRGSRGRGGTSSICCDPRCRVCAVAGCSKAIEGKWRDSLAHCCTNVAAIKERRTRLGLPDKCQNATDFECIVPSSSSAGSTRSMTSASELSTQVLLMRQRLRSIEEQHRRLLLHYAWERKRTREAVRLLDARQQEVTQLRSGSLAAADRSDAEDLRLLAAPARDRLVAKLEGLNDLLGNIQSRPRYFSLVQIPPSDVPAFANLAGLRAFDDSAQAQYKKCIDSVDGLLLLFARTGRFLESYRSVVFCIQQHPLTIDREPLIASGDASEAQINLMGKLGWQNKACNSHTVRTCRPAAVLFCPSYSLRKILRAERCPTPAVSRR